MARKFHEASLRKGRFSESGSFYAVTKCILNREKLLISNPSSPVDSSNISDIVVSSLKYLHEKETIDCWGYVIMPDHLHMILRLSGSQSISEVLSSFSKHTSRKINKGLGRSGRLWEKGFYERKIRSEDELSNQLGYSRENPVRKGYVEDARDWLCCELYPDWYQLSSMPEGSRDPGGMKS